MSSRITSHNRLLERIREARREKRKLFCAFLTLGYPNVKKTEQLIEGLAKGGVDLVELGFPFSDPLADGPTIQYSSEWALRHGVRLNDALRVVKNLRKRKIDIPIVFFSYLNPIHRVGVRTFPRKLRQAGFDGVIVPDCPPEEEAELWKECRRQGLASIFFVAPTTMPRRVRKICARSRGFLYYVSVRGVTGARQAVPEDLRANLRRLRKSGRIPVLVGFGVSTPAQVRAISRFGDGVIVGSALVDRIRKSQGEVAPVLSFVKGLIRALRN